MQDFEGVDLYPQTNKGFSLRKTLHIQNLTKLQGSM